MELITSYGPDRPPSFRSVSLHCRCGNGCPVFNVKTKLQHQESTVCSGVAAALCVEAEQRGRATETRTTTIHGWIRVRKIICCTMFYEMVPN